jgi:hypothetical protein
MLLMGKLIFVVSNTILLGFALVAVFKLARHLLFS